VQPVAYGEIVATVSSKSAGPGTRKNIDEFTRTTAGAVEKVGGAKKGKAIIIINPAEPPLIMRDTVHCLTEDRARPGQDHRVHPRHDQGSAEVRARLPLVNGPVFDGKRVSVFLEVEGLGDYLPKYAGNLDIMTAAAARTAEMFAEEILAGTLTLEPPPPEPGRRNDMNFKAKSKVITLHDMTLRDGMHPKRHLMTLEQMKSIATGSTRPACR
jgi:acetaldehyde/propanal dehydrogenase